MSSTDVLKHIAAEYGTPSYVFDLDVLKKHVQAVRELADGKYRICYSIKANPFITACMSELTDTLEVCSPGELEICYTLHIAPEKILVSGVVKTPDMIRRALQYGIRTFTVESIRHMEMLEQEAAKEDCTADVLLRKSCAAQFGMSEEDLLHLIGTRESFPHVMITGIHCFAGTMQKKSDRKVRELEYLKELYERIEKEYGVKLAKLEYGPGMPVSLFEGEDFSDPLKPLAALQAELASFGEDVQVTVEAGRFFAAACGTYLSRVMDTKRDGETNYVLLDGGMHQINYYGQMMGMKHPVIDVLKDAGTETAHVCICGALCTTADVLVRDIELPVLHEGDVLAFRNAGAYSMCEGAALFLSRDLPAVYLLENDTVTCVRKHTEMYMWNTPVKGE